MWFKNIDNNRWYKKEDTLDKDKYNSLKQDIEKVRLYSNCLSGSTYVSITDVNNIFDILYDKSEYNWYIGESGSTYSIYATPSFFKSIDTTSEYEYYNKFAFEYGLTLKNKFTPVKLINDSIDNYIEVDLATTTTISVDIYQPGLVIDGVILKEGHRLLVKDQKSMITLSSSIDPTDYFSGSFFVEEDNTTSIKYSYYNSDNGIYKYTNNTLVRESDLLEYRDAYKYSVSIKLGDVNTQKQYHLNRLRNGYYPLYISNDPVEFIQKKNWVLRSRVDYNNIYEISYYDIIKHGTQSYSEDGYTYVIPERVISIGEFGMIVNNQDGVSNIVNNKYKVNLRSITETTKYYWLCGDEGTLLRVSKLDFSISKININEFNNLTSIKFYDNIRGIVVGKFNSIYFTQDSGLTWLNISKRELDQYSYNKVIYEDINRAYIGGEGGVFLQLDYLYNEWIYYKRKISKYLDIDEPTEEYLFVDDINDMSISTFTSSWGLTYSEETTNFILDRKEVLFIVSNGGNVILADINNFISNYDFLYLSFTQSKSDIQSLSVVSGSSSVYISSDKLYSIDLNNFNSIDPKSNSISSTYSANVEFDIYSNKIFDYKSSELYLCGNNSSLNYTGYTSSLFEIDSDFNNRYHSKLLFLDYEIGSKLNFFDDSQSYRLPASLTFSSSEFGNYLEVSNKTDELNWLNYYKDVEKTFEYYTTIGTPNQVLFSTIFSYAPNTYFSFTSSQINTSSHAMIGLAPNINNLDESKFIGGTFSIVGSTYSESVFLNRYLIVFRRDFLYICDIGDVLYMESDIITTTFVINKKVVIGLDLYIYCYVDFDQTIVNDLKSYSGIISIINLNKYSSSGQTASNTILTDALDNFWNYDNVVNNADYFAYAPIASSSGGGDLLLNFKLHPVGFGYKLELENSGIYTLSAIYNNKTAYYNMQSRITLDSGSYNMNYTDAFLKFGYKPTYNIYDYLSNISSSFNTNKRFLSMPRYVSLPGNAVDSFSSSNIYIDTNYDTNKLLFGENFKFEWNSIWINTFVDVVLHSGTSSYISERMLVDKKYFDSSSNGYVIEFHKKLSYIYSASIDSIDILSRNLLTDISDDLKMLNNIQRSSLDVQVQAFNNFVNLENELTYKISTDSYSKILLSDKDIKDNLTGIVFIDNRSELTMNIINLEKNFDIDIISTGRYTTASTDYLLINTSKNHDLNVGDSVILNFTGSTYSSNKLNNQYFGYHVIQGIIGSQSFYTYKEFDGVDILFSDPGSIRYIKKDPFLNYQPIDIMEVGVDKQVRRSIEINPDNVLISGSSYSLININYNKYRYELVDGISVIDIYNKYPWALEGVISNAVIGENANGLVWYTGDWKCGRWFGGTWMSGRWISGDWYDGIWNSFDVKYKLLNVDVNSSVELPTSSKWYNGRWFNGIWNNGIWYNGRRYAGDWNNGIWYNGIWNDGTWNNGDFKGGIWVLGEWNSGEFSCDNKPSYWINGSWYGGDFANGIWYNGQFLEKLDSVSRFGTKAFNTRTAKWLSGKFSGGEFHSYLNIDDETGETIASEFNKYSIWNTGIWNGGNWYGGVAYAINFNSGNWYGGIIEEIQIMGIQIIQGKLSKFILNGKFSFNINDEIWVVNNNNPTPYSLIGTNLTPGNYRVLRMEVIGEKTIITINRDLYSITGTIDIGTDDIINPPVETGLRLTTIFKDSNWKSGVWTNGIFDGGYFEGGIWYGGLFSSNSNWGR